MISAYLDTSAAMKLIVERVGCEEMVTYDDELAEAARGAGLAVFSPGR